MNNQPVDQDSNDEIKLPKVEDVFASVPVFSLILYIGIIICWFIDLFPQTPFFANVYEKTIQEYQVWRLFTSIFYSSSLIMSIIIIMNCTTFLHQLEYRLSTVVVLTQFLFGNVLIQMIGIGIQYFLLNSGFNEPLGVTGIWFNMMFKFCYYNRNAKIKFCCFPWKINRLFYPYVFFLMLTILFLRVRLEMVIGLMLGMIECFLLQKNLICCFSGFYTIFQKFFICIRIGRSQNWVSYKGNTGCLISGKEAYDRLETRQQFKKSNSMSEQPSQSEYFKNKKGVSLNDG